MLLNNLMCFVMPAYQTSVVYYSYNNWSYLPVWLIMMVEVLTYLAGGYEYVIFV